MVYGIKFLPVCKPRFHDNPATVKVFIPLLGSLSPVICFYFATQILIVVFAVHRRYGITVQSWGKGFSKASELILTNVRVPHFFELKVSPAHLLLHLPHDQWRLHTHMGGYQLPKEPTMKGKTSTFE